MGFQTIERAGEPPIIVGWCALGFLGAALVALGMARRSLWWQGMLPLRGRWLRAFLVGVAVISGIAAMATIPPLGDVVGSLLINWPSTCILAVSAVAIFQIAKVLLEALVIVARQSRSEWRQSWRNG